MDEPFGKRTSGKTRAGMSVFVRRPLNEYTNIEEVFEFYLIEPEVSEADRKGKNVPGVQYSLTRESRTGRPGVDDIDMGTGMMPFPRVPDEIKQRAAEMADFIEMNPDWEDDN